MIVYRIANKKYGADLSGVGAAMFGGRWNKKGTQVLYTGESVEIALLEIVVNTPPMLVPNLVLVTIEIPDVPVTELKIEDLASNWKNYPPPTILSEIGTEWVYSMKSLALKVPSCVVETAHNYILNPLHPSYTEVKTLSVDPFHFDPRLKKGLTES